MKEKISLQSWLSIPYILICGVLSFSLMPKDLNYQTGDFFQMLMLGGFCFSPFLYFIVKNSKNKILDFKNRSLIGCIAISMMLMMMVCIMSFYLLVIGKMLYQYGFFGFLGYSLMPPIICLYILPYMMHRYSINKDGFYEELSNLFDKFS